MKEASAVSKIWGWNGGGRARGLLRRPNDSKLRRRRYIRRRAKDVEARDGTGVRVV